MPGTGTARSREQWTAKEEEITKGWETIPWTKNGIFSMTSGPANSNPEPYSQTLAREAIQKATVSAHNGVTTILLLELQGDVDLSPNAKAHNQNIQMHKLVTIPAGRLAQWKGCSAWTENIVKKTLTSRDQTEDRPKHSNDSNRFPVLMLAYGPNEDTSFSTIDNTSLMELSYALAAYSNPKPISKDEKKITWHKPNAPTETTWLSIPYFEHRIRSDPDAHETDSPERMREDEPNLYESLPVLSANSRPAKARIIAGRATDTARLLDRMQAQRAASLLEAVGTPLGSLHAHHRSQHQIRQCPCCKAQTSAGAVIPTPPPGNKRLENISNKIKQKIYKNFIKDELCEWAIPSQNPDWNSTRDHEPPQHLGMRRPTRQTKTREPLDIQHSSNHKPSLPANVLQNLIKDIKTKPMEVCFACAIPYASALHGTPSEQGHHLSAWNEICRLAQGIKPTLSMISPQQWAKKAHDPLGRKLHRHLEGRKIALKPPHEEGHSRKGCVLLVSKASGSGRPRAYIKLD
jgi:hypothetical protein